MKKTLFFFLLMLAGSFAAALFVLEKKLDSSTNEQKIYDRKPFVHKENQYHFSTFSQRDFFEEAYRAVPALPEVEKEQLLGLLFNHHLLAPHFIAQAFQIAETQGPKTVVLLSPNHFNVGGAPVLTSRYLWQTPYGEILPDNEIIEALVSRALVKVEEPPFEGEHGIRNIVAFIKHSLPNVRIVPLIVKDTLKPEEADKLAEILDDILPADALLAASLDFSHKYDLATANLHDAESLRVVANLLWQETGGLDIDSRPGLRTFLHFLALRGAKSFTLFQHSNSAIVSGRLSEPETTSYITGVFIAD